MLKCLIFVGILFLATPLQADEKLAASVMKFATEMRDAILKDDLAKVIDTTYPGVVKSMGGRERAIELSQEAMKQIKAKGLEITGCKLGDPGEFYPEGENLFVIIPTENEMTFAKGKILSKSYLLGVSSDKGQTWTFVEGAGIQSQEERDKVLPKLPEKLAFPKKEQYQIISNPN